MMKRLLSMVLLLALLLCGCDRSMNWVISNEPSVWGIVEQIGGGDRSYPGHEV